VLSFIFDDFLNLSEEGLDEGIIDCLRLERFLKLEGQLNEPGFIGTGEILLVLEEALILDLLAEGIQFLL
jgi:hypothetical protein